MSTDNLATQRIREHCLPKRKNKGFVARRTSFSAFYVNFDQKLHTYIEWILWAYISKNRMETPFRQIFMPHSIKHYRFDCADAYIV